eukprot:TRINITY_DN1875_c0_g1_i1.p1 TRINITY_DN1875_c0_g1~~TRINITY_DN1875_c0_g1_i1.p1  ORF type:complete len:189 (+),score=29.56 TRINITY_DN1875_c0_g1_i1:34-600(+)
MQAHDGAIYDFRLSKDEARLYTCGSDKYLKMWYMTTREDDEEHEDVGFDFFFEIDGEDALHTYEYHQKAVRPCCTTLDNRYFISADRGSVISQWKISTGERVKNYSGHKTDLYGLLTAHDGLHFFSGGDDRQLRMWNIASGKCVRLFDKEHMSWIEGLALTQNQKYVFTGSGDKTIKKEKVPTAWPLV